MTWIRITKVGNIPPREGREVRLGSRSLALFNLGSRFVALDNRCPHGGGPLADGIIGGSTVTCPLHNWRICLDTGTVINPCAAGAAAVLTHPVRIEDGVVLLGVVETEAAT